MRRAMRYHDATREVPRVLVPDGVAMPHLLMIDNHDSFTWNLVQYFQQLGAEVTVRRNDAIDLEGIRALDPDGVVLSPGPGRPEEAGIMPSYLADCAGRWPTLGICLGHQAIALNDGARVIRARAPVHGKTSPIHHHGTGVFEGLPSPFRACRYHSLLVSREDLPASLEITAWTAEGEIMGLRHLEFPIEGVQFHPEALLTEHGHALLDRFLDRTRSRNPLELISGF